MENLSDDLDMKGKKQLNSTEAEVITHDIEQLNSTPEAEVITHDIDSMKTVTIRDDQNLLRNLMLTEDPVDQLEVIAELQEKLRKFESVHTDNLTLHEKLYEQETRANEAAQVNREKLIEMEETLLEKNSIIKIMQEQLICMANESMQFVEEGMKRVNQSPVWSKCEDENGHVYYYNNLTKESTWDAPPEFMELGAGFRPPTR